MIKSSELTVLVQGTISDQTVLLLKQIRSFFPEAEVIVSGWNTDSFIKRLTPDLYDKLILSEDPGATIFDIKTKRVNNLNRMLVGCNAGLKYATRQYTLKLRTDLDIEDDRLLLLQDEYVQRDRCYSLLKKRIYAYDIFSIKYDIRRFTKQKMLFHISDWIFLGLTCDIKELFNIPRVAEPKFSQYWLHHIKKNKDIHKSRIWKMSPEQYIVSTNMQKIYPNVIYDNYLIVSDELVKMSEAFISNNFVVFSKDKWGIRSLKSDYSQISMCNIYIKNEYYSKEMQDWDYCKYCVHGHRVVKQTSSLLELSYFYSIYKRAKSSVRLGRSSKRLLYFALALSALIAEILFKSIWIFIYQRGWNKH